MRRHLPLVLLAAGALALDAFPAAAQTAADSAAIRATALDYAEGWYAADAARMQRALHPDLAKRIMSRREGKVVLEHMTAATLVEYTHWPAGWTTCTSRRTALGAG